MMQLSDRIGLLCQDNKVLKKQGSILGVQKIWNSFYAYMAQAMVILNEHIRRRQPARFTLYRVLDFIVLEVCYHSAYNTITSELR